MADETQASTAARSLDSSPPSPAAVVLYTRAGCQFCAAAKGLLGARGVVFVEVDLTTDGAAREKLVQRTGLATLPQLFIDGDLVGGFEEIRALHRSGELRRRVGASGGVLTDVTAGAP
jgi:glutaredoxin 3